MPPFPQTPWSFQLREHVCRAAAGCVLCVLCADRCRVGGSVAAVRSGRAVLRVAVRQVLKRLHRQVLKRLDKY
eukprot:2397077-Pyramimonas_sp.AAC.1